MPAADAERWPEGIRFRQLLQHVGGDARASPHVVNGSKGFRSADHRNTAGMTVRESFDYAHAEAA